MAKLLGCMALAVPGVSQTQWSTSPPAVTSYQKQLLASVAESGKAASEAAEELLLEAFRSKEFRLAMLVFDDPDAMRIASASAEDTLEELRQNLDSMEYTANFGLTAEDRREHPGKAGPNFTTIDHWGYYPNMWQLKFANSTLMQGVPDRQWDIYDGAEVGLYDLKGFAHPQEHNPTWAEAAERPTYTYKSLHRADTGCEVYGAYTLIFRNGVIRDRALIAATDTGGWENACNQTLPGTRASDWWFKLFYGFYDCKGMGGSEYKATNFHAKLARHGHEFHTILGNSIALRKLGGAGSHTAYLARLVWQMLSRNAVLSRIETLWNTEALVLGAVRMVDIKVMVASFPGLFGTEEGDALLDFCRRNQLPLVWGLGDGQQVSQRTREQWMPPPFGFPKVEAGRARLLDPSMVDLTNGTAATPEALAKWKSIDAEVRAFRATKDPDQIQMFDWWNSLNETKMTVPPLRGMDCSDSDLCFGVESSTNKCICRNNPDVEEHTAIVV